MSPVPTLKLNNGVAIPMMGYGLGSANARVGNKNPSSVSSSLVAAVVTAIQTGFRHLDGAQFYGNETDLGVAIKQCGVPRDQLFVTTKQTAAKPVDTEQAFAESLQKLGLDYVDLYLIHAPYFANSKAQLQRQWAEMETIYKSGRAKAIGVSNYLPPHLESILETATVVPAVNQIECHGYLQRRPLVELCRKHGITVAAYAPLSAVFRGRPGPLDAIYDALAAKYGVTTGAIALRWCVDQGIVPLSTSTKKDRLESYLQTFSFQLTREEVAEISEIGSQKHMRVFLNNYFAASDRT